MTLNISMLFLIAAVLGGALLLVQLCLHLFGNSEWDLFDGADADASFKLLSIQGLSAFFTMFGLVGLALLWESEVSPSLAIPGAFAAGTFTAWLMGRIFQWVKGLQSSGNLQMKDAVGISGQVYTRIQKEKPGKVTIVIQQRLMTIDACTLDQETLEQGERIIVQAIEDDGLLRVSRLPSSALSKPFTTSPH